VFVGRFNLDKVVGEHKIFEQIYNILFEYFFCEPLQLSQLAKFVTGKPGLVQLQEIQAMLVKYYGNNSSIFV